MVEKKIGHFINGNFHSFGQWPTMDNAFHLYELVAKIIMNVQYDSLV